jgi:hypothetical protein
VMRQYWNVFVSQTFHGHEFTLNVARDPRTRLPSWLQSHIFRAVVLAAFMLAIQPFHARMLFFTGDEPHYLLAAISFLRDGDFNLVNNYREKHYLEFRSEPMAPQWFPDLNREVIPAEHGTVFPLIIAPAYAFGHVRGVHLFLVVFGFLTCLGVGAAVDLLSGNRFGGTLATLMLGVSPTWQIQATRMYPDVLAGFFTVIGVLYLARSRVCPDRVRSFEGFVAGFCIGILPVVYIKYGFIAAPILLTAFVLRSVRISIGIWTGLGVAMLAGIANYVLFREQGAAGGNFLSYQHLFAFQGAIPRYWKQWFDSHHGLFVYQPYTILVLWAVVHFIKRRRDKILAGFSLTVLAFTGMHMFWTSGPGWCYPGRYLAALLPIICVLVATWAVQKDSFRIVRVTVILVAAVFSALFLVLAIPRNVQPDYIFRDWSRLFPIYWHSWHLPLDQQYYDEPGKGPWLLLGFLILTKTACAWWSLYRAEKTLSIAEARQKQNTKRRKRHGIRQS